MRLARRADGVELSPTFRINARARELRASGIDVLDFSVGEPDFPSPPAAKRAGCEAIERDFTRYTANEGTIELRRAIADKLARDNGLHYTPAQILVSPGAKASLYQAAMALFEPGDEVIVPSPYWVSYPEQIRLAGAAPVIVPAREEDGFALSAAALRRAVGPKTRGLLLNYPCNPTGACLDRAALEALAEVVVEYDLAVVADEIYEKLLYDGRTFTSFAALGAETYARTVVVNGMSKAFAMTGWRLGYAAGPAGVIEAMGKLQSHATSHPASMAQAAGEAALREAGDDVARMAEAFARRRDAMVAGLESIPGITLVPPAGAFYVFPNVSGLFGRTIGGRPVRSGEDVALALLDGARVAAVPGEAFGSASHLRLSYACSMERIEEGIERIRRAIAG